MRRAAGVAAGGGLLILLSLTFAASPLLVPGAGLVALAVAAPAWTRLSAAGVAVERRLERHRVVEGAPLEATVEVRRRWVGPSGAELLDPLCAQPVPLGGSLSLLRGRRTAQIRIVARFSRRGLRRIEPPAVRLQDPLELARVLRRAGGAQEVLVLPRTEPVSWGGPGRANQSLRRRTLERAGADPLSAAEVDGLRPYRAGTPGSRIHWPAVARGAGLLERRLREDLDSQPLVVLDAAGAAPPDHLDAAVRAAASLTLELARKGGCGLLLPGEHRPSMIDRDLRSWPVAHARLALVEAGTAAVSPQARRPRSSAALFYVAASPPAQPARGPAAAAVALVLPRELEGPVGRPVAFEVAGCRGYLIGAGRRQAA